MPPDTLKHRITDYLQKKLRRSRSSTLRGSDLVDRVVRDLECDRRDVWKAFQDLRQDGVLACRDWLRNEPIGAVSVNLPQQLSAAALAWRELLQGTDGSGLQQLEPLGDSLQGMDITAMQGLLAGLLALRRDQHGLFGSARFEVSARYLLGSSKLLDSLPAQALQQFGIELSRFPALPAYVVVAGAAQPRAVILVENPHSFEAAVEATVAEPVAWVCTWGYGLSLRHSQHGEQLAAIVGGQQPPRSLVRGGNPPGWGQLLQHPQLRFWGDLDLEGLGIFERLRSRIPAVALSGLYRPMQQALQRGEGHPYCKAVGKPGQRVPAHGSDIAELVRLCTRQGIDQEMLTAGEIADHWDSVLLP